MKQMIQNKATAAKSSWYVLLFPLCALGISAWLLWHYYKEQGPHIHIHFDDAAAIQPEKTKIRYRGVDVGTVKDVHISEDLKEVVAEVILRQDAAFFARKGTKYALVVPKVNFQGISGLETLIEGTYIAVSPAPKDADEDETEFLAQSALTEVGDDTSAYYIETDSSESIPTGSAVTYRGVKVGSISKTRFNKTAQRVELLLSIENRYTSLIRDNTVFWRKVGVQAKLGLFGSEFKMNSIESIMSGGLSFATPQPPAPRAKYLHRFSLAPSAPKDYEKWNPVLD